jgi:hypothetical protein
MQAVVAVVLIQHQVRQPEQVALVVVVMVH